MEEAQTPRVGTPDEAQGFEPTTAENYPAPKTYPATLPSGVRFLLRRPNMLALLRRGDIPNPLIGVVEGSFMDGELSDKARALAARAEEAGRSISAQAIYESENGLADDDEPPVDRKDVTNEDGLKFIDMIVWAAVVKPPLSFDDPAEPGGVLASDGKLSMGALDDLDKMFVFEWATEQLDGAATFRGDGAVADPERDGGTVRAEAERPARDPVDAGERLAQALS